MKKLILLLSLVFVILITVVVYAKMTTTGYDHDLDLGAYDVEVLVEKGWNLILFPSLDTIEKDSEIQEENIKAGFFYFPDVKSYVEFHPDQTEFGESIEKIFARDNMEAVRLLLSSAWIYSDKKGFLKYSRIDLPGYHNLFKGWNLFTLAPEIIGKSIDEIKGDCVIEKAYNWNPKFQEWEIEKQGIQYNKIREEQSFFIGYGLVLKVANDCQLGEEKEEEETIPEIPTFPTNGE